MKKKIIFLISFLLFVSYSTGSLAMEFDMLDNVDIHGFISQGYLKSNYNNFFANTEDGTTQFNEVGINFSTDITERLRIGVQFFARDMGTIGNNEIILDWAVADYRFKDWLGLRAGNMKLVNGLYNETRDIDMIRTNIFLPQSVYNEAWRESSTLIQGIGVYGEVPIGPAGSLSYDGQYGTISIAPDKGAARLAEDQWPLAVVDISPLLAAADPAIVAAAFGSMSAAIGTGEITLDEFTTAQEQAQALAGQNEINLISVDTDEINVEQAYSGKVHWNTPVEGLIIGASTLGYTFDAQMDSSLASSAMQTIAAYQGLSGMLQDYGDNGNVDSAADHVELFNKADGLEGFADYGIHFPIYPTTFKTDAKTYVASMEYTWRSLVLAAEYMRTDWQIKFQNDLFKDPVINALLENASDYSTMDAAGNMNIPDFTSMGWYVSSAYRFTYWFELGAYYSEYYPDEDDKNGKIRVDSKKLDNEYHRGWLKDTCMTMRFDINENWVAKLEGHSMDGAAILLGADNPMPTDGSERYDKYWMLYAAKLTYSF
ncbi:MAG: hypothetical protein JRI91_07065 [Deltaproteobacteria bacterium]|nr:hypothetical protein [Deltaproteobacteria bacterium]